jgi:uncharacterized protein
MTVRTRPHTEASNPRRPGPVTRFFLDTERRPRTFWRCAGYLIAWFVTIGLLSGIIGGKYPSAVEEVVYGLLVVPAVLGVTYLFRRFADRRDWRGMGVSDLPSSLPVLAAGFGIGIASVAVLVAAEWMLGWLRFTGSDITTLGLTRALLLMGAGLVYYAATAFAEDLAFRGYLFRNSAAALPLWASIVTVGVVFGVLHVVTNPLGTPWFVLIVPISTVLLQGFQIQTRLITGALWLSIGWHAAWDWAVSMVVNLDVPGAPGGNAPLHVQLSGPLALAGEPGFVEGGLLAGLVTALILAAALLVRRRPRRLWTARIPDDVSRSHR